MSDLPPQSSILTPGEVGNLILWFEEHAVSYPWGDRPSPYRVWISEIMLQQTVVTAAVGHFTRWMKLFPRIPDLAEAGEQEVLKAWEGLGYYSRARNIRKGALYLMEHHGGSLPDSYEELIRIPGIGDYTARAILSLAFAEAYPVLDANVRRIGQRLKGKREWGGADDKLLLEDLTALIPRDQPGVFNCALMQLGQLVCRVRSPGCERCPLNRNCRTRLEGLQDEIPAARKRRIQEKDSALFLLVSQDRLLLTQRSSGIGRGLWFIPSVPYDDRNRILTGLQSLVTEKEELPVQVHLYTTWKETLHPLRLDLSSDPDLKNTPITAREGDALEWVPLGELDSYPCPTVYRTIMNEISRGEGL